MRPHRVGFIVLVSGLIVSGASAAQDAVDDWDFGEDPARKLSIAAVSFETFGVAVRCLDDRLSVVLSGLPVVTGERRLGYRMADEERENSLWISGRNSPSAFSVWPRDVAAGMSRGGRLSISVPDGEATRRYSVDLPASPQAINRVFRACGEMLDPPLKTPRRAARTSPVFVGNRLRMSVSRAAPWRPQVWQPLPVSCASRAGSATAGSRASFRKAGASVGRRQWARIAPPGWHRWKACRGTAMAAGSLSSFALPPTTNTEPRHSQYNS